MEKEQEGQQAIWAATEMKYKRQLAAMRKRNVELTEKIKEVNSPLTHPPTHPPTRRHRTSFSLLNPPTHPPTHPPRSP